MTLRLAPWLLAMVLPLSGIAQPLPSIVPDPARAATPLVDELLSLRPGANAGQGMPVVPIWSGANGQLLAVVALPREWSGSEVDPVPGYRGPSTWHLAGTSSAASGLVWQFGNGFRADALLGQHMLEPGATCTASNCSVTSAAWANSSLSGMLGLGWTSGDGSIDLSYGLSWLQSQPSQPFVMGADAPVAVLPWAGAMAPYGLKLDSETSMYARSQWRLGDGPLLDLGASYGRGRASAVGQPAATVPGIDLDQLSLSLGLGVGSLRGAVVGHVIRSDAPLFAGKRWTTLDLGVSWRTPWSAEVSVGAQNVLNAALGGAGHEGDVRPQSRTPYIQYRQDL